MEMNKVNRRLVILLACLIALQLASLLSCGDKQATGPDGRTPGIYGVVKDVAGNSLEGVGIHVIFSFQDQTAPNSLIDDISQYGADVEMSPPPSEFQLYQNFPNPFNPETTIGFDVPAAVHVSLVIRDIMNQEVKKLIDSVMEAGAYMTTWDGTNGAGQYVSNGLYAYQMIAEGFSDEKFLCLNMLDPEQIRGLESIPMVSTDHEGEFILEYSSVPFGGTFVHTDGQGTELGQLMISNVSIALIKEGYQSLVRSLPSDMSQAHDVTYTLTAN
jgi:hypothetical protein